MVQEPWQRTSTEPTTATDEALNLTFANTATTSKESGFGAYCR
jgi:hypothetical protein